ncbi:MAG: DNA-binding response regulator [Chloroflexi bacterium]|nr:MAG: DNA-binding response regulator [Chloroflexota bacterium]
MNNSPNTSPELLPHILVAEDEEFLRNLLIVSLERAGYRVTAVPSGSWALSAFQEGQYDLVLLDIMMPELDGFSVCIELRKRSDVPIIMLTALNSVEDMVQGFELGADDFITKPFTFKELYARIQAILRRVRWSKQQFAGQILDYGEILLNDEEHLVTVRGQSVHLTPIEYQLLYYLMRHPNQPIPKDVLFREVWGYEFIGGTNLVEVAMRRLREKIEEKPSAPRFLVTVRGVGYKFVPPSKRGSSSDIPSEVSAQLPANGFSSKKTVDPSSTHSSQLST